MRNKEDWNKRVLPNFLKKFPPRIQKDLQSIDMSTDVPDVIESCYIHGPTGYGKTLLSAFMMIQEGWNLYIAIDIGKVCVFVSATDLIDEIKETFNKGYEGKTEQDIIRFYSDVHFLVIDDLGTVKMTDWVYQTIYSIINRRYEGLKKTIITSNKSLKEMEGILGDSRIPSRIARMGDTIKKTDYKK